MDTDTNNKEMKTNKFIKSFFLFLFLNDSFLNMLEMMCKIVDKDFHHNEGDFLEAADHYEIFSV